jgi:DNA adenine methylase
MPMKNDKDYYYSKRSRFNELVTLGKARTKEAASLFYYLNRTGYNGLCRFNRSGGFNVPLGRHAKIGYVRDFSPYKAAFSGWEFSSTDFERLEVEPSDLIYADPPYDVEFTQYSKEGFGWNDQVRLAHWLAGHQGPVIVSNQATSRVIRLYRALGFQIKFLMAPRKISCSGDRREAREILAYKNI